MVISFHAVAKEVVFVFVFMRYLVAMVVVAACLLPWLSAAFLLALACSLCLAIAASSSLAFLAAASCLVCAFEGWLCMYVCIEVALCGIAHGEGRSNWAKGRDPSGSWVQYPNPYGTIDTTSLTLGYTYALVCSF